MGDGKEIYDQGMHKTHVKNVCLVPWKTPMGSLPGVLCVPWEATRERKNSPAKRFHQSSPSLDVASYTH